MIHAFLLAVMSASPPIQQTPVVIPPPILEGERPATAEPPRRWPPPPSPEVVKFPKPRRPAQDYLTSDDYPPAAIAAREQGRVEFVVLVGPDGRVSSCYVTASSGSAVLDRATCQVMQRRARYTPATDKKGNPVRALVFQQVVWRLP
jgi:protein TonB